MRHAFVRWLQAALPVTLLVGGVTFGGEIYGDLTGGPCPKNEAEGQQGGEKGDQGKDNSDPIYLATGDFQHVQTDLLIPGRGMDFEIKRMYRSRSGLRSYYDSWINPGGIT